MFKLNSPPNQKGSVLHRNASSNALEKGSNNGDGVHRLQSAGQAWRNPSLGSPTGGFSHLLKAGVYLTANVLFATSIVFANKTVLTVMSFKFVYALTLLHVLTTFLGMLLFAAMGLYERKSLPVKPLITLSAAFVGYIVFWNISLQVNTVGFYQLSKICITPAVLAFNAVVSKQLPTLKETAAVVVLCCGVALATISDGDMSTNLFGIAIAIAAIAFTAVYQVFVGSKQKELEVGSMALMAGYTPIASLMLLILVPCFEPIGVSAQTSDTLLGFPYTPAVVAAIALTAVLGLAVSLSTFLVIGATSSVTYNVVGHVKTVIVFGGGFFLFGESLPPQRLGGLCLAMSGIIWYSYLKLTDKPAQRAQPLNEEKQPLIKRSVSVAEASSKMKASASSSKL